MSLSFTPIHRFSVQTGQQHYITDKQGRFLDGLPITQKPPVDTATAISVLSGESAADRISKFAVQTDAPNLTLPQLQGSNPASSFNALAGNTTTPGFNSVLNNDFTLTG